MVNSVTLRRHNSKYLSNLQNQKNNACVLFVTHKRIFNEVGGIESMGKRVLQGFDDSGVPYFLISKGNAPNMVIYRKKRADQSVSLKLFSRSALFSLYSMKEIILSLFQVPAMLKAINIARKRNFVPVILAFDSFSSLPAFIVSSMTNTPSIIQTHGLYTRFIGFFTKNIIVHKILLGIQRAAISNATLVLSVNDETIDYFNTMYAFQPMKYRLLPTPIDTKVFSPSPILRDCVRKELGINSTAYVAGFVGRLSPEKNVELLLYAFDKALKTASIPDDALLLIVGDGPLHDQLGELSSRLSFQDKILFTGFRHDVYRIMNAIDTLVLPSQAEGLPCVVLEAMSCGVPVVCSDLPCHTDFLAKAKCGFAFEAGKVSKLVECLSNLANNRALRKELGSNGRHYIESNHAINQVAKEYAKAVTDSIKIRYKHKSRNP